MTRAYDPNDPRQVGYVPESESLRIQQHDADWRWLMAAPQGKRILAQMFREAGLMEPVFSDNPLRMAQAEGRRSVVGEIYTRITKLSERGALPALLAEVMGPPDVRNRRRSNDRDNDGDAAGG